MAVISTTEAQGQFTKMLIAKYKSSTRVPKFLRSFFSIKESNTKFVSIEVQRGTEKLAVDVQRATGRNRNTFSRSTEKLFVPPYYNEYFDATDLDYYDRLWTSSATLDIDPATFAEWVDEIADKIQILIDKIERSYEVMCSDVFNTGVITLNDGSVIDFKRDALSKVVLTGAYWDNVAVDPRTSIQTGCMYIRSKGEYMGSTMNLILSSEAFDAMINNTKFNNGLDLKDVDRGSLHMPERAESGATLQGSFAAGSFKIIVWTYPQVYDNGTSKVPYIPAKKAYLFPEHPNYVFGFAAVPQLRATDSQNIPRAIVPSRGQFHISEYIDERNATHEFDVKSTGVAIPLAIDTLYTMQVLA